MPEYPLHLSRQRFCESVDFEDAVYNARPAAGRTITATRELYAARNGLGDGTELGAEFWFGHNTHTIYSSPPHALVARYLCVVHFDCCFKRCSSIPPVPDLSPLRSPVLGHRSYNLWRGLQHSWRSAKLPEPLKIPTHVRHVTARAVACCLL